MNHPSLQQVGKRQWSRPGWLSWYPAVDGVAEALDRKACRATDQLLPLQKIYGKVVHIPRKQRLAISFVDQKLVLRALQGRQPSRRPR